MLKCDRCVLFYISSFLFSPVNVVKLLSVLFMSLLRVIHCLESATSGRTEYIPGNESLDMVLSERMMLMLVCAAALQCQLQSLTSISLFDYNYDTSGYLASSAI
jgi:hypothetical protein